METPKTCERPYNSTSVTVRDLSSMRANNGIIMSYDKTVWKKMDTLLKALRDLGF